MYLSLSLYIYIYIHTYIDISACEREAQGQEANILGTHDFGTPLNSYNMDNIRYHATLSG